MAKLTTLRAEITQTALASLSNADTHRLVDELETIKDNVREALLSTAQAPKIKEPRYG
jgi:MarR family transcriptional regulator for hemolysin